ncbi:phosphohistidine phosphatase SixA [Zophobihabitans entericus]|uniref:Phosphohistidine phosphatase SixA n=1 Tax=Zophobihabitans entericus TaxID=1635327 RepID=A0A6G9IAV3_9GAMM|nr:phosphohistidine phosphatase SixA [Zophobihabitans entericus]QIQ20962.1 phosphohistidine phosphatase SixA [Zophobihabitans entericus]
MYVYIMRHGEAGYSASSDSARTLTLFGKQQSQQMGLWLKDKLVHFDYALVSPYIRAQQTLAEVCTVLPVPKTETSASLTPGGSSYHVMERLQELAKKGYKSVFIVSHLPLVGYLVSDLCPSVYPPMFSTAAIACVSLSSDGVGKLEWMHAEQ